MISNCIVFHKNAVICQIINIFLWSHELFDFCLLGLSCGFRRASERASTRNGGSKRGLRFSGEVEFLLVAKMTVCRQPRENWFDEKKSNQNLPGFQDFTSKLIYGKHKLTSFWSKIMVYLAEKYKSEIRSDIMTKMASKRDHLDSIV